MASKKKEKAMTRRQAGMLGGLATFKKLGSKGMSKMGKLGAKAHWKDWIIGSNKK